MVMRYVLLKGPTVRESSGRNGSRGNCVKSCRSARTGHREVGEAASYSHRIFENSNNYIYKFVVAFIIKVGNDMIVNVVDVLEYLFEDENITVARQLISRQSLFSILKAIDLVNENGLKTTISIKCSINFGGDNHMWREAQFLDTTHGIQLIGSLLVLYRSLSYAKTTQMLPRPDRGPTYSTPFVGLGFSRSSHSVVIPTRLKVQPTANFIHQPTIVLSPR